MRGIQYAAAYRFNHRRLWNTGSSAFADDDSCKRSFAFPRHIVPELCSKSFALQNQRAQGMPDARCTRGLACDLHKTKCTRAYRFSGEHPTFPAQWLYGLYVISPVSPCSFATVAPEKRELLKRLTPASGRQDHTTSPYASCAFAVRFPRPPHPTARSWRSRAPLLSGETGEPYT